MERGADVLAAYVDGTARYVNHSGKIIIWDISDPQVGNIIGRLLERSKDILNTASTTKADYPGGGSARVTVLMPSGNRFVDVPMRSVSASPINHVLAIGAELMTNLIARAKATNRTAPG